MKYVVYEHPAVEDKHFDSHHWKQYHTPVDSESEAREIIPAVGSPLAEEYVYTIAEYEDDEDVKVTLTPREKRRREV